MFGIDDFVIASVAAPVVGGLIGAITGAADREQAQQTALAAYNELLDIGVAPDMAASVALEPFRITGELDPQLMRKFEQGGVYIPQEYKALSLQPADFQKKTMVGKYSPQIEQAIQAQPSKVAQISEDPKLRDAQLGALQALETRAATGFGPQERATLNKIRQQTEGDTQAKLQAIKDNMAARGISGSGAELAAQLQAAQAGANQAAMQGDELAASAAANALQAIQAQASQAGGMRTQDFNVANTRAAAEDAINRFNTENAIGRQTRNVSSLNQADLYNLGQAQDISNANTDLVNKILMQDWQNRQDTGNQNTGLLNQAALFNTQRGQSVADANTQQYYNLAGKKQDILNQNTQMQNADAYRKLQGQQQNWQNQMGLSQSKANAKLGQATQLQNQANQQSQMWAGIGSGVGQGLQGIASYKQNQDYINTIKPRMSTPTENTNSASLTGDTFLGINPEFAPNVNTQRNKRTFSWNIK